MQITIQEKVCWMCDAKEDVTTHHALPQYLKPKRNVLIPLCNNCHKKLHGQDLNTATALLYKTNKILESGIDSLKVVGNIVKKKKKQLNEITIGDVIGKGKKSKK